MAGELAPHVIVYQNANYVGSLYQSATNDGLPISTHYEGIDTSDQSHSGAKKGSGGFNAKANIPGLSAAEANLAGGLDSTTRSAQSWSRRHQIEMSRDTALYLHKLHDLLDSYTKIISSSDDAATLNTGALVKFQGRFRPDPIGALLDLSNPDTVAEITRFAVRQASRPTIDDDNWNIERLKAEWEIAEQEATTKADLARTIAGAAHTDFRRGTTTEFHCSVSDSLTALVVCEAEHFVTADSDRPLDGEFTVFGKVITKPERDVPIFRKNKILHRMDQDWVESILLQITKLMKESVNDNVVPDFLKSTSEGKTPPPFDLDFPAKIEGLSFTVLPIAIYA